MHTSRQVPCRPEPSGRWRARHVFVHNGRSQGAPYSRTSRLCARLCHVYLRAVEKFTVTPKSSRQFSAISRCDQHFSSRAREHASNRHNARPQASITTRVHDHVLGCYLAQAPPSTDTPTRRLYTHAVGCPPTVLSRGERRRRRRRRQRGEAREGRRPVTDSDAQMACCDACDNDRVHTYSCM
jgi:hypothetical protein